MVDSVLYITYDGLLEPLGSSQVVPYVLALAERGFEMEILSFEKSFPANEVTAMSERLSRSGVRWTRMRYHNRPSLPATFYDVSVGASIAALRAFQNKNLILHARSYLPALMALPAKHLGAKLLFDTRGLWVDERIESGHWREGSLVVRLARKAERACSKRADHFVHLTSRTQEGLRKILPDVSLAPFSVIPTCADLERFTPPGDKSLAKQQMGLPDVPVLVHSGTISGWYLSDFTFEVGASFVRQTGGVFLVLTKEVEFANQLAETHGVPALIRTVAPLEMGDWLRACDVGIALVRPSFAKTASCPTKVGEYLGAGMAAGVTRGVGDLEEQLGGSEVVAMTTDEEDPDEFVGRLLRSMNHPGRGNKARSLSKEFWDLRKGVSTYERVYRQLGRKRCPEGVPLKRDDLLH